MTVPKTIKNRVSPISISSSKGNTGHLFRQDGGVSGEDRDVPPTHGGSSNISSTEKRTRGGTSRVHMAHNQNSRLVEGSDPSASAAVRSPLKRQSGKTREHFKCSGGDSGNERYGISLNLQKESARDFFENSVQSDNDKNLSNTRTMNDVARQADDNTQAHFGREKTALGQRSTTGETPPKGVSGTTGKTSSKRVSRTTGGTPPKGVSGTTGKTSSKRVSGTTGGTPPKGVSSITGRTNNSLKK